MIINLKQSDILIIQPNHFSQKLNLETEFNVGNEQGRYVYKVNCKGNVYILKDFKIHLEHLSFKDNFDLSRVLLFQTTQSLQSSYTHTLVYGSYNRLR